MQKKPEIISTEKSVRAPTDDRGGPELEGGAGLSLRGKKKTLRHSATYKFRQLEIAAADPNQERPVPNSRVATPNLAQKHDSVRSHAPKTWFLTFLT